MTRRATVGLMIAALALSACYAAPVTPNRPTASRPNTSPSLAAPSTAAPATATAIATATATPTTPAVMMAAATPAEIAIPTVAASGITTIPLPPSMGRVVDPRIRRADERNLTPRIFIASEGLNGVEVWQGEPPQKLTVIPSGGTMTHNLGVSNSARWVVASNRYSGNVTIYDTQTLTTVAKIAVGPAPHDMAWLPDDSRLYISLEAAPYIAVIDTATWKTLPPILVDTPTHDLTIMPGGKEMWATGIKYRGLLFIDLEKNKLVDTYKYFPEGSHDAYYRPQEDEVWLSSSGFIGGPHDANPNIVIFDRATRKIKDTRPYGLYPFHSGKRHKDTLYFPKNDDKIMWFSDRGWSPKVGRGVGGVLAIDVKERKVIKSIPTGNGPFHISYGPNGWLYLINQDDSSLSIVDTERLELVRTIKVAPSPHGISVVGVEP